MAPTMEQRSVLAHLLNSKSVMTARELTTLALDRIPRTRELPLGSDWICSSVLALGGGFNHLVAHPEDLALVEPPVGAISLVRQLARMGVPFSDITRGYHLCASRRLQLCLNDLRTLTDDIDHYASEAIALNVLMASYYDLVCKHVFVEYERELDRSYGHDEWARADRILKFFADPTGQTADLEQALGYRLRQHHLALIAWSETPDPTAREMASVRSAVSTIAESLGGGAPLMVMRDTRTVWAWVPHPERDAVTPADVARTARDEDPCLKFAVGSIGEGPTGFVASHHHAAAAYQVGCHGSAGISIFPYRDLSSLAFLSEDLEGTRAWVAETLGPLAVDSPTVRDLRHTLSVFLSEGRSATAAARLLHCHKNTVSYRVGVIQRLLDRPIADAHRDLDLALHASRWLGPSVLQREAPE